MISAKNLWVKVLFEISHVRLKDALDAFFLSIANSKNGEGCVELIEFSENNGNFSCIIFYRFKEVKEVPPAIKEERAPDLADILDGVKCEEKVEVREEKLPVKEEVKEHKNHKNSGAKK